MDPISFFIVVEGKNVEETSFLKKGHKEIYGLYRGLNEAGFTKSEALELVKAFITSAPAKESC